VQPHGRETLADRIDALGSADREWAGYLFPLRQAESSHVIGETIQARSQRVAERADVRVRGETPTSKIGRRLWYTACVNTQKQLLENLDAIAADQRSSDARVVLKNYLSEAER